MTALRPITARSVTNSMVRSVTHSVTMTALVGLWLTLATGTAHAQANCDWYAKTALRQQQDNERMKCGFKGEAWITDLKAHAAWCQSVSPDAWKAQAKRRDQDLTACAKK